MASKKVSSAGNQQESSVFQDLKKAVLAIMVWLGALIAWLIASVGLALPGGDVHPEYHLFPYGPFGGLLMIGTILLSGVIIFFIAHKIIGNIYKD